MTKTHILCLLMILRMLRIIILHLPVLNQGGLKEATNKVLEDEAKLVTDIVGLL